MGAVAQQFMTLGAAVVQEVAKLKLNPRNSVRSASTSFVKQLTLAVVLCPCSQSAGTKPNS